MSTEGISKEHDAYLRRGAMLLGLVSIGGYFVDYAFNLGLTHFLDPHEYGDFKLAHQFAFFFGLAVLLGGDRAAPMALSGWIERSESRKVWEYLRFYLRNGLWLGLGLMVITWAVSSLHLGSVHPGHHHPLSWAVLAVPLNAAAAMIGRVLQSARRPAAAVIPWRIGFPLVKLAIFGLVVARWGDLTVFEAILISVAATALLTLWQWRRVVGLRLVEIGRALDAGPPRAWLVASLPMMGSFLVALALKQSDLYFLELLGDEDEVGHYAASAMAAHFLPLVQVTVIGLVAPLVRPALDAGSAVSRTTFRQCLTWMLGFLVPVGVGLAAFGEPILALFGPAYEVGHGVLLFLIAGYFFWAAAALSALWLQYQGRGAVVLAISIATLVVDSLLNLVLIPRYGMTGAAGGTALTLTVAAAAVLIAHRRSAVEA